MAFRVLTAREQVEAAVAAGTDLSGADLSGAVLTDANLSGADLTNVKGYTR